VVRDWYELGPTGVGIVSAIAGFIAGLAATFIQKWREDRSAESRARVEIQEALVKGLTTELLAMRDALTTFLVAGGEAPSLGTGAYNTLSKAILAFLNDNERIDYLQRVDELYGTAVANYHHQRNTQARTEILRQAAERVIKQIESLGGLGAA
jgi:hypothetical protein